MTADDVKGREHPYTPATGTRTENQNLIAIIKENLHKTVKGNHVNIEEVLH